MTFMRANLIFGEESYTFRHLVQQMLTGKIVYPKVKACDGQKYYPMYYFPKIINNK